jgi:hypothetical protein
MFLASVREFWGNLLTDAARVAATTTSRLIIPGGDIPTILDELSGIFFLEYAPFGQSVRHRVDGRYRDSRREPERALQLAFLT